MDWKENALSHYYTQQEQSRRKAEQERQAQIARFQYELSLLGVEANPDSLSVDVDGVVFTFDTIRTPCGVEDEVRAWVNCPDCGEYYSITIKSVTELGAFLLGQGPSHLCD